MASLDVKAFALNSYDTSGLYGDRSISRHGIDPVLYVAAPGTEHAKIAVQYVSGMLICL